MVRFQPATIKKNIMKKTFSFALLVFSGLIFGQNSANEQFPKFPECFDALGSQQESCFYNTLQNYFYNNFKVPQELQEQNYKGTVIAVFEVDTAGTFKVLYTDAAHESLKKESNRVLESLPKVTPATFSGRPTYAKFSIKINIPLVAPNSKEYCSVS